MTLRTAPSPPARLHLTVNSSNSDLFLSAAQNSDQSLNANEFFSTSRQTTSSTNRGDEDEDEDSAQLYKSITKPASPPGVAKGKENKLSGAKPKGKGKGKGKKEKDTGATQKCLAPPSPPKTRGRVFSDETLNYELQKLGVAPQKNAAAAAAATPSPLPSTSDHFLSLSCNDGNALRSRRDSEILLARGSENIDIFESPICPEPQSRGVQMVTSTPMLPCPDVDERKKPPPSKGDAIKQDLKFCLEDVSEEGDDPEEHDPGEHAVKIVINGGSSDEKKRSTVRTTKKREEQEEPNREEEKEIVESSVLLVKGGKNWRRSIWTRKGRPSPNKASRKTIVNKIINFLLSIFDNS